ncbi:MAG: RHS repeat-associated core domain-containing protein [Polyangiales bacterium]
MGRFENGAFTHGFIYQDALNPVAELGSDGSVRSLFVYGSKANTPDMIVNGADVYRVVSDLRGSVRRVVNVSTGAVVQALDYDAWGRVLSDSNPGFQPFGYAGGLYDPATELIRFGARDYDPYTARWTAKDPILFSGGDSDLYAYVGGDPINYVDRDGRHPVLIALGLLLAYGTSVPSDTADAPADLLGMALGASGLRGLGCLGKASPTRDAVDKGFELGTFKSAAKWERQMAQRGWTREQIGEAVQKGERFAAENLVNKGNSATRYVHPETGRSVVIDNATGEVIHLGGNGFRY